jgi:hypothetical protein
VTRAIATGWRNYEFTTDLACPNGHPPGAHPLYVGMSSRPGLRYEQHERAPWRRYATGFVVHPQVYATEEDALAAERARIEALLPLANREHNWANPCRVDFGPAPGGSARRARTGRRVPMSQSSRHPRRWSRRARRRAWLAGAWLVLALAGTVWCWLGASVGLGDSALVGAGGASALFAAVMRRRGRRRYRRR